MNDLEREELAFRLAQQAKGEKLREKMEATYDVLLEATTTKLRREREQ